MFTEMGDQKDSGLRGDGGRVRQASRGPMGTLIWASHSSQPEARGRGLAVEKERSLGMQLVSARPGGGLPHGPGCLHHSLPKHGTMTLPSDPILSPAALRDPGLQPFEPSFPI